MSETVLLPEQGTTDNLVEIVLRSMKGKIEHSVPKTPKLFPRENELIVNLRTHAQYGGMRWSIDPYVEGYREHHHGALPDVDLYSHFIGAQEADRPRLEHELRTLFRYANRLGQVGFKGAFDFERGHAVMAYKVNVQHVDCRQAMFAVLNELVPTKPPFESKYLHTVNPEPLREPSRTGRCSSPSGYCGAT